jgi:hypothetical protein
MYADRSTSSVADSARVLIDDGAYAGIRSAWHGLESYDRLVRYPDYDLRLLGPGWRRKYTVQMGFVSVSEIADAESHAPAVGDVLVAAVPSGVRLPPDRGLASAG